MEITDFIFTVLASIIGSAITFYFSRGKYKFESLHKKRFEVLEEVYKKLVEVNNKCQRLVAVEGQGNPDKFSEELHSYHDSLFAVSDFVKQKAIFLSLYEHDLFERFFYEVEKFENNLGYKKYMEIYPSEDYDHGKVIQEIREGVFDAIPKILTEIESEFSLVLGLKD